MTWNYNPGDRVRVARLPSKYFGPEWDGLIGAYGTIQSVYFSSFSVKLDEFTNNRGNTGYFYFSACHLEPAPDEFLPTELNNYGQLDWAKYIQKDIDCTTRVYKMLTQTREIDMEKAMASAFEKEKEEIPMLKNYRVAGIKFLDNLSTDKTYPYALYDADIAIGDRVVVMTGHHGMSVAEVRSIGDFNKDAVSCGREIICKVSMDAYNDRQAKAKKMAELKKEMDEKVKALQEVALYELMAEKDPELKTMLEMFKSLES